MKPGTSTPLRAGPLTLELDGEGSLRFIRLGDREVLRRVYVAVRDRNWATVPVAISDLSLEQWDDAFAVDLVADHVQGSIHFRWKGTLRGEPDGTIRFQMDGEAISAFKRNRIGICVLHPIDECAGQPCRVERADGSFVDGAFPRLISPHQPFFDIRAFFHEVAPGVRAEVRYEGDVFEMEDHRNWSDANFKTYSTPLALSRPVELAAGTSVRQSVTLRLLPGVPARPVVPAASAEVAFEIDRSRAFTLPKLGVALIGGREPLTDRDRARLRGLGLAHLRADLYPSRDGFAAAFERAALESQKLELPLELALVVRAEATNELRRTAEAIRKASVRVASCLLLPLEGDVTPPEAIGIARALLPGLSIGAGSHQHFTELNRTRAALDGVDFLAFPNSPHIHMEDETTTIENLAALPWLAETARSFAGGRPLALTPVTLKRLVPGLTTCWAACHLGWAARSGFDRVTYAGIEAFCDALAAVTGSAGSGWSGAEVLATRSTRPLVVDGLALRRDRTLRVVVANLTRQPQSVGLPEGRRTLAAHELAVIDSDVK